MTESKAPIVMPKLLERARLAFVVTFRHAFGSELVDPNLKYDEDQNLTKIKIFRHHPQKMEFFPCIMLSTAHGDASVSYLQDELIEQSEYPAFRRYNGKVVFTISANIYSKSTLELERIIDHVILYLRHLFLGDIRSFGIIYTRDITVGGEQVQEVDNAPLYSQTIDIPCYMEYTIDVDQSHLDKIRQINFSAVNFDNIKD